MEGSELRSHCGIMGSGPGLAAAAQPRGASGVSVSCGRASRWLRGWDPAWVSRSPTPGALSEDYRGVSVGDRSCDAAVLAPR